MLSAEVGGGAFRVFAPPAFRDFAPPPKWLLHYATFCSVTDGAILILLFNDRRKEFWSSHKMLPQGLLSMFTGLNREDRLNRPGKTRL